MDISEFDEKFGSKQKLSYKIGSLVYPKMLLSTGIFALDMAHGIGGVFSGGVMQLMGPPAVGKSSTAYRIIADGLSKGMSALLIDSEAGFNEDIFLDTLDDYGVDVSKVNFRVVPATNLQTIKWKDGKPTPTDGKPVMTIERTIPLIEEWIVSKDISPNGAIVVFDSLDFMISDTMVGSTVDAATIALTARRMKQWLRMFSGTIRGSGSLVIIIHQVSANIDPYAKEKVTFAGGNALRHSSHFSVRFKDIGADKNSEGRRIQGTVTKSKQGGNAWRVFEYVIRGDCGIDNIGAIYDISTKMKIMKELGAGWCIDPSGRKLQGKEKWRQFWIENPKEFRTIRELVLHQASADTVSEEISEEDRKIYDDDIEESEIDK